MSKFLINPQLKRMYTPLSFEESLQYVNCSFARNKTAFNKSVVTVETIGKDCVVIYKENKIVVIYTRPSETNKDGGTTTPISKLKIDDCCKENNRYIGRRILVYNNINTILGRPEIERPVQLYVDKYIPYDITDKSAVYTVISKNFELGCKTNLGKYGSWV